MRWMMFIKHLQTLPLGEAGRRIKELGLEGVDLTVRPGGSVLPENVRTGLPEAQRTLHDWGLEIPLVTTGIVSADAHARDILETAASLGIRETKLGYVPVKQFGTFESTLDAFQREMDGLEKLARETGVRVNIHSHSGGYLSAIPMAVWQLIKDRDPKAVGAYVDPGHLVIEGSREGWRLGMDLLRERIALVAIKDLAWAQKPDEKLGKNRWVLRVVPFDQGAVPWPEFFDLLRKSHFDGWISVHSEYQGANAFRDLSVDELLVQTRQDLQFLARVLAPQGVKVPQPTSP